MVTLFCHHWYQTGYHTEQQTEELLKVVIYTILPGNLKQVRGIKEF